MTDEPKSTQIASGSSLLTPYFTASGLQALRNLSSLLIAAAVAQVCGLISVVLLTQSLGAEQFGVFAFALSLQSYLMLLGAAGLRPIIVRELTRRPEALNCLWTAYIAITGGLGLVLAVFTIAAAVAIAPTTSETIVLTMIAVGNVAACVNPVPFYDYRHAQSKSAILTTAVEVTALVVILALYQRNMLFVSAAAAVFAIKWIGSTVLHWQFLRSDLPEIRWEWSLRELRELLASSSHLTVSGLLGTIPLTAGILIVRFYHGDAAAGVFGLAMYAPRAMLLLTTQANRVLEPHVMGRFGRTRGFILRLALVYALFLTFTPLLLSAVLWYALTVLLPKTFVPALPGGVIMLFGAALLAAGRAGQMWLIRSRLESTIAALNVLAALAFLPVTVILVRELPVLGPAWALTTTGVLTVVLTGFALLRLRHVSG